MYQHVAKHANRLIRAQVRNTLQVLQSRKDIACYVWATSTRLQRGSFSGKKTTSRPSEGLHQAALDRVFVVVTHSNLSPLYIVVKWNKPVFVFDHALILLLLPRETIGVGFAASCSQVNLEVSLSRCHVKKSKWRTRWMNCVSDLLTGD